MFYFVRSFSSNVSLSTPVCTVSSDELPSAHFCFHLLCFLLYFEGTVSCALSLVLVPLLMCPCISIHLTVYLIPCVPSNLCQIIVFVPILLLVHLPWFNVSIRITRVPCFLICSFCFLFFFWTVPLFWIIYLF